jgi:hypothetical protein
VSTTEEQLQRAVSMNSLPAANWRQSDRSVRYPRVVQMHSLQNSSTRLCLECNVATETRGLREPESRRIRGTHGRVVISESVVCAALDDEAVLLNVETGLYFGLDAIGSRIWELLAEGVAPDRICEQLYAEY